MCKVLGLNRSTYYKCLNKKISNRDIENQKLDRDILVIYNNIEKGHGTSKIHRELLDKGWKVSLKRVQRRMEILGIRPDIKIE